MWAETSCVESFKPHKRFVLQTYCSQLYEVSIRESQYFFKLLFEPILLRNLCHGVVTFIR